MFNEGGIMRSFISTINILILTSCILFAGDDWSQQSPSPKPYATIYHDMAYVGGSSALLFGGYFNYGYGDDTWIFDVTANSWTLKSPSSAPTGRRYHAMAYIGEDQGIVFGGSVSGSRDSDTWIYDLSADSWTEYTPSPAPGDRQDHAIAYIGGDQVLLFGGYDGALDDETWVYDLSADTWTNKSPSTKPSARQDHALAYIGSDQVLLFGGNDGSNDNETWLYDLSANTWTNKSPSSPPPIRIYHAMAYMGGDQVLLFGGRNSSNYNDTWIYDLSANTWTEDSNTSQPSARFDHAMCETSMSGDSYIVLFGGTVSLASDETWTFGGGDYSLPVVLSSFSAKSVDGKLRLEWTTESENENLGFIVERKSSRSGWIEIASYLTEESLKGGGSISRPSVYSFTDETVTPGEVYDYRLADISFGGNKTYYPLMVVGVQVEDELPRSYALLQNYPNPFNPITMISYELPEQSDVTLIIYDMKGGVIRTLRNQEQSAGHFEVQWNGLDESGNPVSTGVYFARLEVGDYIKTIKMVYLK